MQLGVLCTTHDKVLPLFNLFLVHFFTSVSPGILYQLCVGFISFLSLSLPFSKFPDRASIFPRLPGCQQ